MEQQEKQFEFGKTVVHVTSQFGNAPYLELLEQIVVKRMLDEKLQLAALS